MDNKVWYITGGSGGLGFNLLLKLLTKGFCVTVLTRNPEKLENELFKYRVDDIIINDRLLIYNGDVSIENQVKKSIELTILKFGKIDVVVNNSSYGVYGPMDEISDENIRAMFDVNFFGVLNVIRCVSPYLKSQRSGLIMNISSKRGWSPSPFFSCYSASKYAINGLTLSIVEEMKPYSVGVILISPGAFRTEFGDNLQVPDNLSLDQKDKAISFKQSFSKSIGDPDKFSNVLISISKVNIDKLPLNLYLGSDSYNICINSLMQSINESKQWFEITKSTDNILNN